jgi:hypothetical protein
MTIHRIVEQEQGFTAVLEFLSGGAGICSKRTGRGLSRRRSTPTDKLVLCLQSSVIKTPHHTGWRVEKEGTRP